VSQLQKVLRPDEVFLEYVVGNGRTWLMAVRRNSMESLPIEIQESDLMQLVEVYRSAILRGKLDGRDSVWKAPSVRLYATLVRPAMEQKMIARDDHIIISPHSSLHLLPFHTLLTSKKTAPSKFLIEDHTISYVESATQLVNLRTRPARPMETMLAVGPDGKRLPHVERELQSIPSPFFRTVKLARNGDANADAILAGMRSYSALHIAAHATLNVEFPLYSSIRAADRNIELHEIMKQNMAARLVVLSACESGLSAGATEDMPRGADAVSFPRAFMAAGAQYVIASLWLVEDDATALLMERFYGALPAATNSSQSRTFSQSLTLAQLQFITENRISGSKTHPFFWGAFYSLGGN
jgi:CHAT domain-containing protein